MWLLFHYYIFILCATIVSSEVITLAKDKDITCVVTGDSVSSRLYISPCDASDISGFQRRNENNMNIKLDDTWTLTSNTTDFGIVTDARWTEFSIGGFRQQYLYTNLAFSFCANKNVLTIFDIAYANISYSKGGNIEIVPKKSSSCQWEHYILKRENNSIILKDIKNKMIDRVNVTYDESALLIFPNTINGNYKIHQYDFFYAKNVSSDKSYVSIPSTRCISMYVSVDEGCFLNITFESTDQRILKREQIEGFNKKNSLKTWKKYEIRCDSGGEEEMRLGVFRGCNDKKAEGYWAIDDIKICDPEKAVYISKSWDINSTDYVCKTLDSKYELPEMSCEAPMIGKNCNISCTSILGAEYSNCQGHKICLETNCQCAWGYHGRNCNQTCGKNRWGLNCANECNSECPQCDPQRGCTRCSKKTFGKDCSKKLPVVLYPPKLVDISNDSITISVNLEYGANEETPEYYVIQYKILNAAEDFKNYSTFGYPEDVKNKILNMSLTTKYSYDIRILLLVNGRSFGDDIPNLIVYPPKRFLNVINGENNEIKVSWIKPNDKNNRYVLKYTCYSMCSSVEESNETEKHTINIKKSEFVSYCSIKLFTRINKVEQLVDKIDVTEKIGEEELPKNVTLIGDMLQMELNNCSSFSGPLDYYIKYQCASTWCRNQTSKETNYTLNNYTEIVSIQLKELIPFTIYKIDIIAKRSNQENLNRTYSNIKSSLGEFHKVMNLSVYSIEDDTLFIRWKDPARLLKEYKIFLLDYRKNVINVTNATEKCSLWDSFTCANISGKHDMSNCSVLVFARKTDVDTWIEPNIIENVQTVTKVPENLQLHSPDSSNYNEVILTWEHPVFTYGKLDNFVIKIVDGKNIITFYKNIMSYSKKYNQTITVDFGKNYNISVWGSNKFDGEKAYVFLMVSEPIDEFSQRPFLMWCLKSCYLTPPYEKKVENFIIQQDGKTLNYLCADRTDCSTNNSVYEIKENIEKAKNTVYSFSLVYNSTIKSIHFNASKRDGMVFVVILICILSAVFLSYGIFCYTKKKKKTKMKSVVYSELLRKNEIEEKSPLQNRYQIERTQNNDAKPIKGSDDCEENQYEIVH